MRLIIATILLSAVAYAAPALWTLAPTGCGTPCVITAGSTVTFNSTVNGDGNCTVSGNCKFLDNQGTAAIAVTTNSATITTGAISSARYAHLKVVNTTDPNGGFGRPTVNKITNYWVPIYVGSGSGSLSISVSAPWGSSIGNGPYPFVVTNVGANGTSTGFGAGSNLSSNRDPWNDVVGDRTCTGMSHGNVYTAMPEYAMARLWGATTYNDWVFVLQRNMVPDTYNCTSHFGVPTNFATFTDSFTVNAGQGNWPSTLSSYGGVNTKLFKDLNGKPIFLQGGVESSNMLAGTFIGNHNQEGAGGDLLYTYHQLGTVAQFGVNSLITGSSAGEWPELTVMCVSATQYHGGPPSPTTCKSGQSYLGFPVASDGLYPGNTPSYVQADVAIAKLVDRAWGGVHNQVTFTENCASSIILVNCDIVAASDASYMAYYQYITQIMNLISPVTSFVLLQEQDGGFTGPLSFQSTVSSLFHSWSGVLVGEGQTYLSGEEAYMDFHPGKQNYQQNASEPAGPGSSGAANPLLKDLLASNVNGSTYSRTTTIPQHTAEGGGGTAAAGCTNGVGDSDHPYNEYDAIQRWGFLFRQVMEMTWQGGSAGQAGTGLCPPSGNALNNRYRGRIEFAQTAYFQTMIQTVDPAALASYSTPSLTNACGKTSSNIQTGALSSSVDALFIFGQGQDRTTCSGATFSWTAAYTGTISWFDIVTGVSVGTPQVVSSTGSITVNVPTLTITANCPIGTKAAPCIANIVGRFRPGVGGPKITSNIWPLFVVGTSGGCSFQLSAVGGSGSYTWSIAPNPNGDPAGGLPPGCSLNASTGAVTGTATAQGPWWATVKCVDTLNPANVDYQTFIIPVNPALAVLTSTQNYHWTTSRAQTVAATYVGGLDPKTVAFSANFTNTLTLTRVSSGGGIVGTTVASGPATDSITATITDALGTTVTQTINATVVGAAALGNQANYYFSLNVDNVQVTQNRYYQNCLGSRGASGTEVITISGGSLPTGINWAATPPSPAGVAVCPVNDTFYGTATATPATYPYTLSWHDGAGHTDSFSSSVIVNAAPSITSASLPAATVGVFYQQALTLSGGTAPNDCFVEYGSYLPAGLLLQPYSCVVYGYPTTAGTTSVSFVPVDNNNVHGADTVLSLVVNSSSTTTGSFVPSGTLTCSGTNASGSTCASLMDFNTATFWTATATGQNAQVDFGATVTVTSLYVIGQDSSNNACGTNAQGGPLYCFQQGGNTTVIEGSANGSSWTLVDTLTTALAVMEGYPIYRPESASYRYFRLRSPSGFGNVAELQFVANATTGVSGQPVAPTCTPFGGNYPSGSQTVTCSSSTTSASLYYTTDGSTPVCTSHGTLYSGPVSLTFTSMTFEIIACDSTLSTVSSQISTAYFKNYGFQLGDVTYDTCTGIPAQIFTGATIGPIGGKYYRSGSWWTSGSTGNSGPPPFSRVAGPEPIYIFTSTDLYNWCSDGQPLDIPSGAVGFPNRPQLSYNPNTGAYQIFGYQETTLGNLSTNKFYIATSTTPNGPSSGPNNWTWTVTGLQPDGHILGDFSVWVEPGACYLVNTQYVASPQPVYVTLMNTACTASSGTFTDIHTSISPGQEGFTFFKRGSEYFIISSQDQRFGWSEPQAYSTATNPVGTWSSSTTLYTSTAQSSRQFQVPGKTDCWIFYSDNWAQPHNTSPTAYVQMQKMTFPTATSISLNNTAWDLSSCPNSSNSPAAVGNTVFGGQVQ